MQLKALVAGLKNAVIEGSLEREIAGITYDSRRVTPGMVFVAISGQNVDGHAYIASALAGLTDVDAITVSMARLARDSVLSPSTASASILLACAMNTMVKAGIAILTGGPALRKVITPLFAALFGVSLGACLFVAMR